MLSRGGATLAARRSWRSLARVQRPCAMETVRDCVLAVVLIPLIPWRYVLANYVRKPGDRWRRVDRRETILAPGEIRA